MDEVNEKKPYVNAQKPANESPLPPEKWELFEELKKKSEVCANCYLGAIMVMQEDSNPERYVQAAHSLRELMDKIPKVTDVQIVERGRNLKTEVNNLNDHWVKLYESEWYNECYENAEAGISNNTLKKFLQKCKLFFEWFSDHHHSREKEMKEALKRIDISPIPLPDDVINDEYIIFEETRDYFVKVAHHSNRNIDSFNYKVDFLEKYLKEKLIPKPIEDSQRIDELIALVEKDG